MHTKISLLRKLISRNKFTVIEFSSEVNENLLENSLYIKIYLYDDIINVQLFQMNLKIIFSDPTLNASDMRKYFHQIVIL